MRKLSLIIMGLALLTIAEAYKNPYYVAGHSVNVHLFEWKWDDIAAECERFLGPKGFGGIQISPPNENVVLWEYNRPWWERYQPMSYKLVTRSGDEQQLANMIRRCNNAGVRIYVDAVINHMTGEPPSNVGTAGSTAVFNQWYYPAVPYWREHFNYPVCSIADSDWTQNAANIRNCEFIGLKDLNQANEHVRQMIVDFMNKLIDLGVAGFRIDAATFMWPEDLRVIYNRLHNLNTDHGFPPNARPYIYQEVTDYGGNIITRDEYTPIAAVTEFLAGRDLTNCFRGRDQLRWLRTWGPEWGLMAHGDAIIFIDNHDNERTLGGGGDILNYKEPRPYRGAIAFLLAHPYGEPQIMSSFVFWDSEVGPPMDSNGNIISPAINSDETCGNGWVCQHRWRQIYHMVGFRNVAGDAGLNDWWDNSSNQIAFCRGNRAFIAINNDMWNLNENLQTCLPAGTYCDVISGNTLGNSCVGKTVTVGNDGRAQIYIGALEYDMALAIHIGPESRL
ncbi:alpha-amylase 2-like isoform X1 [Hyposmocoma kahamanoa]|uniref:alpha-amylase 2-like isoform X1 n=1 Tax=Hyposmocoma kahamanoa TaxID=1477025 RepID=UPI000E6D6108|nr:alpha-amylase 2-like isoform X1 [Hyposmocoma kahamanoa]